MTINVRIEGIRKTLAELREARKLGTGAATWGKDADLEYLLACYDSIKAQYDGLMARSTSDAEGKAK